MHTGKTLAMSCAAALAFCAAGGADTLRDGFAAPPSSAKPHVWWHWMNGNVTREGITADLEAMARAGIGGAQIFDVADGIPAGDVEFCGEKWFDMLAFANDEAKRLGLELALSNCSGWSASGGPWVRPEDSMKHVVFTEKPVRGGETVGERPEAFGEDHGFYCDIALLAFPRPSAEAVEPADFGMASTFRPGDCEASISFDRPFPLSGLSLGFEVGARHLDAIVHVDASPDGVSFTNAVDALAVYTARFGDRDDNVFVPVDAGSVLAVRVKVDLSATTGLPGKVWDGVKSARPDGANSPASTSQRLVSVRPEARARIPEFGTKAFVMRSRLSGVPYSANAGQTVDAGRVVDLSGLVGDDGMVDWTAPEGEDWVVVRFGYCSNGVGPRPATKGGAGLEVDKLSKAALRRFFAGYVDRALARLGGVSREGGVNNILVDSWEVGCQNWTDGFERAFEERTGYGIVPWLPVLSGRIVGSPGDTERFLADFRRVVSDLFVENYANEFHRLCRERGLLFSLEGYGSAPCDDLRYARRCDVPMGEFWAGSGAGNCRFPASIAHVWGQRFVGAEAFTSGPNERWSRDPFAYKAQGDRAYCQGVNRMIYHRWAMQPWTNPGNFPGMTMGPHGSHFERTQTWWNDAAPALLLYQARCQWMLQEGVPAADVLVFAGDGAPGYGLDLSRWHDYELVGEDAFGHGRAWDVCGGEAILAMRAEGGRAVAPSGASYGVVAVLPRLSVDKETAEALGRLAARGVPVVAAAEADAALSARGVGPDFECLSPKCADAVRWTHRIAPDGSDVYFVAAPDGERMSFEAAFRVSGRAPEVWNPDTGAAAKPRCWRAEGERTVVSLDFDPSGSAFVVFRPAPTADLADFEEQWAGVAAAVEVEGPWQVSFADGRGAPAAPVEFESLQPWNESADEGIRHYSGSAVYGKSVEDPRAGGKDRLALDLGDVKNVAVVSVNGRAYPVLWKPPFRVDISDAPSGGGRLDIEIRVTNLWPNRLIGDDALPCDAEYGEDGGIAGIPRRVFEGRPSPCGRHTFTTWRLWKAGESLLASGLIGPVRLLAR